MIRQCDVCFLHVVLHAGDFLSVKQTGPVIAPVTDQGGGWMSQTTRQPVGNSHITLGTATSRQTLATFGLPIPFRWLTCSDLRP